MRNDLAWLDGIAQGMSRSSETNCWIDGVHVCVGKIESQKWQLCVGACAWAAGGEGVDITKIRVVCQETWDTKYVKYLALVCTISKSKQKDCAHVLEMKCNILVVWLRVVE